MKNKIALESMAMDLKRAALGYHNNSLKMAERFREEALVRKREINLKEVKPYLRLILQKTEKINKNSSEDALMLSTLIQNYTRKYL
ncbi:MAG: hypothetical protein ACD_7C00334G0003 [uncultured bacterium]|nr:MAG: hypothetical protein ACD_7C00334G0003 [uncultured bacterium]